MRYQKLILTCANVETTVPLHSKNWRKGNVILMSSLVAKRVIKHAIINEKPDNGKTGYYSELVKFEHHPDALPCYHCRQPISVGSMCYSKHRGRNTCSYYHMACAIQVNLIEEEIPLNGQHN